MLNPKKKPKRKRPQAYLLPRPLGTTNPPFLPFRKPKTPLLLFLTYLLLPPSKRQRKITSKIQLKRKRPHLCLPPILRGRRTILPPIPEAGDTPAPMPDLPPPPAPEEETEEEEDSEDSSEDEAPSLPPPPSFGEDAPDLPPFPDLPPPPPTEETEDEEGPFPYLRLRPLEKTNLAFPPSRKPETPRLPCRIFLHPRLPKNRKRIPRMRARKRLQVCLPHPLSGRTHPTYLRLLPPQILRTTKATRKRIRRPLPLPRRLRPVRPKASPVHRSVRSSGSNPENRENPHFRLRRENPRPRD